MGKSPHSVTEEPALSSSSPETFAQGALDSVWEEPLFPGSHAGSPYAALLRMRWARQRGVDIALTFLLCLLAAGPFAIAAAFVKGYGDGGAVWGIVLFGPLIEEFAKISVPVIILERAPWRWTRGGQLVFVCAVSGLVFAVIENLLYLHVYIHAPSPEITHWRWTICTLLHVSCSTIAGLGLRRVWCHTRQTLTRPDASRLAPCVILAVIIHGAYNMFAIVFSMLGFL